MKLSCSLDDYGIYAPTFDEILFELTTQYKSIFGSDVYLGADSQDGQWLAIQAKMINDNNNSVIQTFNSFSPTYAVGVGLSNAVKLNGIQRLKASPSLIELMLITGQVGTLIPAGIVTDSNSNGWKLPENIVIPTGGSIIVSATALVDGAIQCPAGSANKIATPTLGWQSAENLSDAIPGDLVETDSALRQRQTVSVAFPALSVIESLTAAVHNYSAVIKAKVYENDTNSTDSNGIPAHSISVVSYGGGIEELANIIASKKTPGTGTYGTTTQAVWIGDVWININFFIAELVPLTVVLNIHPHAGFTQANSDKAKSDLIAYINSLNIGEQVYLTNAISNATGNNFNLVSLTLGYPGHSPAAIDVPITFKQLAQLDLSNITLNLV